MQGPTPLVMVRFMRLAQLVERDPNKVEVRGSNPLCKPKNAKAGVGRMVKCPNGAQW